MQILLKQLKEEMEVSKLIKNVRTETLVRKLKKQGISEREEQILRIHIMPVFGGMTLAKALEKVDGFCKRSAAEKVKSSSEKELNLLKKLILLGDPTFRLPKVRFKKSGKKFEPSQILEIEEILKVINTEVPCKYRLACEVALYTGMRRSDIAELKRSEVNFKKREIRFSPKKGGDLDRIVLVPICNLLVEVFSRIPTPLGMDDFFFPDLAEGEKPRRALTKAVSRAFTRAGFEWFSFHKLRHSAACILLDEGVPISTISTLLGHGSIKITLDHYAKVRPRQLHQAVSKFDKASNL
jgi:integrase